MDWGKGRDCGGYGDKVRGERLQDAAAGGRCGGIRVFVVLYVLLDLPGGGGGGRGMLLESIG